MLHSKDNILGTEKISKLMFKLGIPSVLAQLVSLLYNIIDRIYIGHIPQIGDLALTGVGVTFPIVIIINAFAVLVGSGGAPLASIAMGAKKDDEALDILGNGMLMLMFFSVCLFTLLLIFKKKLLLIFGATPNIMEYADTYITICIFGIFFTQFYLGANSYISGQGAAKTAMKSVLVGAVTNIILDPIFIFVFHMGVKGAAIATVLSQMVSAVAVMRFLLSKKSLIKLDIKKIRAKMNIIWKITSLGISPFVMQVTESAIIIVFNRNLREHGGYLYIGTMTILQSIMQMIFTPVMGFRNGIQPIISYNYGANNFERVKKANFMTIGICFVYAFVFSLACIIFPGGFARIFADQKTSGELILLVEKTLPIYISGMLIFGIQMGVQAIFVALSQAGKSLFLALLRKVFLLIPLVFILARTLGAKGIFWAEPISDWVSGITSGLLFLFTYKKILLEKENLKK